MPRKYIKKPIGEGGRRSYKNSDDMLKAYNAVQESRLGVRQAAEIYNVDYYSLLRRINDACPLTAGVGRFALLTESEENDLARGIALCAEWGWGLRRDNVCSMIHDYLRAKDCGGNMPPGPDWLEGFLSRHKEIVLRKSQQLSIVRIKSLTPEVGDKWLSCVQYVYKKYEITSPEQVFNCDETGFSIDPAAGFVLAKKGSRVVTNIGGSGREQVSILGCCSAAGKMWPPLIIYKAKRMNILWTANGPPGTTFTVTDSGWMETDAFASWFI